MTNLSQRTQERLAKLISVIAECEKKTEMVRQVLAEQKMFEPYTGKTLSLMLSFQTT
jgi:hypothetical protein